MNWIFNISKFLYGIGICLVVIIFILKDAESINVQVIALILAILMIAFGSID